MRPTRWLLAMYVLCALGCSRRSERGTMPPPGTTHVTPQEETAIGATEEVDRSEVQLVAGKDGMSEANVIAALIASNEYEIRLGEVVSSMTKQEAVRRFADMLTKDHGAALTKIGEVRARMGVTPEENHAVEDMREQADGKIARIAGISAKDLDRTFLEMAVADHQKTLDRIDGELLPAARNGELRSLLRQMRPTVMMHRDEAQKLLDKMK